MNAAWYAVQVTGICGVAFWAAWWAAPPVAEPWRTPDATGTMPCVLGVPLKDSAMAAAEQRIRAAMGAAVDVRELGAAWARAAQREAEGKPARYRAPMGERPARGRRDRVGRDVVPLASFAALGVSAESSADDVRRAFRRRVAEGRLHPDQGGDAAAFKAMEAIMRAALAWAERRAR